MSDETDARCNFVINGNPWWGIMRCALPAGHTESVEPWEHAYTPDREHCEALRLGRGVHDH